MPITVKNTDGSVKTVPIKKASFSLYNADCLEKMKELPPASVDLIICDLPYGCLTGGGGQDTGTLIKQNEGVIAGCSWDIKIDLDKFWEQVRRIRRNDSTPTIHFCTTKFGYDLIRSNEKEFRYDLVWTKPNATGFLMANKMPMRAHEMMYVFSKAGAYYERIDITGDFPAGGGGARENAQFITADCPAHTTEAGRRCVKSYTEFANKKAKGAHPTAKPIDLYKWLISRYCPPGGTVLDPTFGGCSSGAAAKELGRNYIGIEMNKAFFDTAKAKLSPAVS
jgi:site-specific DNA-methyltransferase (adenine-specific)